MTRLEQTFGMVQVGKAITAAAIGLLLAQGTIHLYEAPAQYAEVPYLGVLFVLILAGALVATFGMVRGASWGWWLGLATAAGPLVGYVLSRSVGIPGVQETALASIFEPLGIACVVAEALFVGIAARVLLRGAAPVVRVPARVVAN
jgi:hypothetical protein